MANIAQMVNVLQAMILTDGPKMVLTPTYHAFEMYMPFQDATFLPTEITTPNYSLGPNTVPAVSVTAARDTEGKLVYALVNLDPNREALVTTRINGTTATGASGRVLTSKAMDAHNTPDAPDVIAPVKISATRAKDGIVLRLPAKSLTVVRIQ